MKSLRNKVILIGNTGVDPAVKEFENGRKCCRFSLATNEHYTNQQGEKVTQTQWHNIVVWGKQAELADQLIKKGQELAVEGKLIYRAYEDAEGQQRHISEVEVSDFLMVGKKLAFEEAS